MKNVFFALAFMLVGTFAFANNSVETELNSNEAVEFTNVLELITNYESTSFNEKSCTIKTGHQIINNGEVVYEEINTFTITGMSCDEFFFYLSAIRF